MSPTYTNDTYFLFNTVGVQRRTDFRGEGSVVRKTFDSAQADYHASHIMYFPIPDGGELIKVSISLSSTPNLDIFPELYVGRNGSIDLDEVGGDYAGAPNKIFGGEDSGLVIKGTTTMFNREAAQSTADAVDSSNYTMGPIPGSTETLFKYIGGTGPDGETSGLTNGTYAYQFPQSTGPYLTPGFELESTEGGTIEKTQTGSQSDNISNYVIEIDSTTPNSNLPYDLESDDVLILSGSAGTNAQLDYYASTWTNWWEEVVPFQNNAEKVTTGVTQVTSALSNINPQIYEPDNWITPDGVGAWVKNTAYTLGQVVGGTSTENNGQYYKYECTKAGTSEDDITKGPTGTSSSITDGTAEWDYIDHEGGDAIHGYYQGGYRWHRNDPSYSQFPGEHPILKMTETNISMGVTLVIKRS